MRSGRTRNDTANAPKVATSANPEPLGKKTIAMVVARNPKIPKSYHSMKLPTAVPPTVRCSFDRSTTAMLRNE